MTRKALLGTGAALACAAALAGAPSADAQEASAGAAAGQEQQFEILSNEAISEPFLMVPEPGAALGTTTADGLRVVPSPTLEKPLLFLPQDMADQARTREQRPSPQADRAPSPASQQERGDPENFYNPRLFLEAMVNLRIIARTCEPLLPSSPLAATAEFDRFFAALDQQLPAGVNAPLRRTTGLVIRPQAASMCQDRLNEAIAAYQQQYRVYQTRKPDGWPEAPAISARNWCSSSTCADLR